jgi:hypothetical protein
MARTFTSDFLAACQEKHVRPYHILQIDWFGGTDDGTIEGETITNTKYYFDRDPTSFTASGTRCPTSGTSSAYVIDWGVIHQTMKEHQVGTVDQMSVKLQDRQGEIRRQLSGYVQQRELVTIWRMFDADAVTWPTDAAKVFVGVMRPFAFNESDGTCVIPLDDISKRILRTVELRALKSVFPEVPEDQRDKVIPTVWGAMVKRVKAVCIKRPWATRITQGFPKDAESATLTIEDHPTEMGTTAGTPQDIWIGADKTSVVLSQSSNPDRYESQAGIDTGFQSNFATATIDHTFGYGGDRTLVINKQSISPQSYADSIDTKAPAGANIEVSIAGAWTSDTILSIEKDEPFEGYYRIKLTTNNSSVIAGSPIKFGTSESMTRPVSAGTLITPYGGEWVYAVNSLPSQEVVRVEGWGRTLDDSGSGKEGFVIIGGRVADTVIGTVNVDNNQVSPYVVDLADDTYEELIGRKITTVTFGGPPRGASPEMLSNDIYVTLSGCETSRGVGGVTGDIIDHPAAIVAEYLEHPSLGNVDSAYIDADSFDDVIDVIPQRKCSFAVTDSRSGLDQIQDIARQCRSHILIDQGKVSMRPLYNASPGIVLDFTQDEIVKDSLEFEELTVDDLVSRVISSWRKWWDDKSDQKPLTVLGIDQDTENNFGVNAREFEYNIYRRRSHVEADTQFNLVRWKSLKREVKFSTPWHAALQLQPGDWIRLSYNIDFRGSSTDGWHSPSDAAYSTTDLTYHGDNWISSAKWRFTQAEVGGGTIVISPTGLVTGWTAGTYSILEVDNGRARLNNPPADSPSVALGKCFRVNLDTIYIVGTGVDSDDYIFTTDDIGRVLQVRRESDIPYNVWYEGTYTITGVGTMVIEGNDRTYAWFTIPLADPSGSRTGASYVIADRSIYDDRDCEVLEVKDNGPKGIFDIVARHNQPYIALTTPEV